MQSIPRLEKSIKMIFPTIYHSVFEKKPSLNEYIAKKWCCLKKTHFRYEKLIFRQKEPHIRISHYQFSNAEKKFHRKRQKNDEIRGICPSFIE